MEEAKVGVFLSNCGKQLSEILDFKALTEHVKKVSGVALVVQGNEFWRGEGLKTIVDAIKSKKINRLVVAETLPKLSEIAIVKAAEEAGLNPYLVEVIDLKDHCAWPHRDTPSEATEKAKAMLSAAIERAKLLEPLEKLEFPAVKSVLVIGGGIAGMQAAEDLADLGFEVHLIEKAPFLGGLAARAGRFFPTDDCAICIQSPASDVKAITHTSRKCVYRSGFSEIPNLNILTNSKVVKVEGVPGNYKVTIEKKPRYVDESKCVRCDLCTTVCPVEVPDEYNAKLKTRKAIYINTPPVHPPVYVIDESACKFQECAKCVEICPTKAVKLNQKTEKLTLNVGGIIVATGFKEYDPSVIKEYHYGEYPNVITNLELARMIDGFGPTNGAIIKPSDRKPAKRIVFIQCVGSRDRRWNPWCSSICCMISLKNAMLIKSAYPDTDITICYIDIRTTGREHEYYYEKAREMGIKFVKGRPTEISHDPDGNILIVDVEDAILRRFFELEADLVVLATAMVPSEDTKELAEMLGIELDQDGFFKEYNAKLRPTETKIRGVYLCGGATFPKDAPTSSLHAHSAAVKAAKFLSTGKIIKDQRTAFVNEEYCGDCEFCPVICPFNAITLVPKGEDHFVAQVSDLKCEGCGICVGTCPVNAIELRHSRPKQMEAQMNALLSVNGTSKPLILAITCSECGHTAVDSSGMAMMQYPANVRVMKVPCTGILQVHQFLQAFKAGAQGVMVVGCKTDGCHYEVGSQKAQKKVDLAKVLLKEYGIEPERLEMLHMVFIEGDKFAEAAQMMTERIEKLGPLQLM
ncbi:MAG: hydrogenase iron-sulfur subunit [Candidatus Bathyarchaeota archaeon]|jgi:heterodisulfide reductase subunit A|nr:hydrogenase iron-sulfur subunit [Candidatus Bathyarchaeota archaeon A05DMB-5]MDH7558150.1 hydrogenase iron-sulfur subunit [Candidatus Bathyarchaeota archaeon]